MIQKEAWPFYRTGSWTGPPQGKRAQRVGISSRVVLRPAEEIECEEGGRWREGWRRAGERRDGERREGERREGEREGDRDERERGIEGLSE